MMETYPIKVYKNRKQKIPTLVYEYNFENRDIKCLGPSNNFNFEINCKNCKKCVAIGYVSTNNNTVKIDIQGGLRAPCCEKVIEGESYGVNFSTSTNFNFNSIPNFKKISLLIKEKI